MRSKAEAAVKAVLAQGGDPRAYRLGLAAHAGVAVEVIDEIIATAGAPRVVDAETVAQERLAEDRRMARSVAAIARNHEEE